MSKEIPHKIRTAIDDNDKRKISDIIKDKPKAPRRAEFHGFLKNAASIGYLERTNKELNTSRLTLAKLLEQEITRNMKAVKLIESLKMAMQIHAGDICSANNESDQFIGKNQDLEEANQCLADMIGRALEVIAEYGAYDGGHHKQWVLDQTVHLLAGTEENYQKWIAAHNREKPSACSWETGIAP